MIPAMDHIDAHLTTATQNTRYSIAIRAALEIGNKTLNRYYNKMDYSEVYRIAMGKFISQVTIFIAGKCVVLMDDTTVTTLKSLWMY